MLPQEAELMLYGITLTDHQLILYRAYWQARQNEDGEYMMDFPHQMVPKDKARKDKARKDKARKANPERAVYKLNEFAAVKNPCLGPCLRGCVHVGSASVRGNMSAVVNDPADKRTGLVIQVLTMLCEQTTLGALTSARAAMLIAAFISAFALWPHWIQLKWA